MEEMSNLFSSKNKSRVYKDEILIQKEKQRRMTGIHLIKK
jgi:hypothetical protein